MCLYHLLKQPVLCFFRGFKVCLTENLNFAIYCMINTHNKFSNNLSLSFLMAGIDRIDANDGGNMVREQHQTLKAVTDSKLLALNFLGQYLSYLETQNFCRKN